MSRCVDMFLLASLAASAPVLHAQELEPRAYSNVPIGMNFALAGYTYVQGNILLDPSLPLKDAEISEHIAVVAYAKSLNLWGDSGKIDAIIPYAWASGKATFAGQTQDRKVNG